MPSHRQREAAGQRDEVIANVGGGVQGAERRQEVYSLATG